MIDAEKKCPHLNPVPSNGRLVCPDCAEVLDDVLYSNEYRIYDKRDNERLEVHHEVIPIQVTGNHTLFRPTRTTAAQYRFLYHRSKRFTTHTERVALRVNEILHLLVSRIKVNIPANVVMNANTLFNKLYREKLICRFPRTDAVATVLWICIRQHKIPCSLKGFASDLNSSASKIVHILPKIGFFTPHTDIRETAERVLGILNASPEISTWTYKYLDQLKTFQGTDPTGMVGALIYLIAKKLGVPFTQRHLAEVSHVSEVTIRNNTKKIATLRILAIQD